MKLRSAALLAAVAPLLAPLHATPQAAGRVVVLGFDGADARTAERLMDEGLLPNLQRLRDQGTFAPLVSTNPAESAAGWAALNTGRNPVGNGVPSFIRRDLAYMGPRTGHISVETVPIGDLEPKGLLGLLARWGGPGLTAGFGLAVALAFALLLLLLLRVRWMVAVPLASALGAVGAYGAHAAERYVPSEVPGVYRNAITADGFWVPAAQAGVPTIALDAALAFDRPTVEGARVLGGLGLPDVRSALNGEWFVYTTDDFEIGRVPKGDSAGKTGSGRVFRVDEREGRIQSELFGPVNFWKLDRTLHEHAELERRLGQDIGWQASGAPAERKRELERILDEFGHVVPGRRPKTARALHKHRTSVPLEIERLEGAARVTVDGRTQEVALDRWSDWFRVTFDINPLIRVQAITRCRIVSLEDPFQIYFDPLQIDPTAPPFWQPISQPGSFSKQLVGWSGGLFETLGWACLTNQLKDGQLGPQPFLEDIEFTLKWRQRLTAAALERDDWRILFSVFSTPDRVQHMLYRHYDREHPRHDPELADRQVDFFGERIRLGDAIPAMYRQIDRVVGEVAAELGPEDTLLLCADHGFTSYRRGMEVNNWLARRGYLVLRDDLESVRKKALWQAVDWSATRAYSLGLGMVYLNLEGREPQGIVQRDEALPLLRRIAADFVLAEDPGPAQAPFAEPRKVGLDATVMPELYPSSDWGTDAYPCADLMLGFDEFYRASWGSVMGELKLALVDDEVVLGPTYTDNGNDWSGDHASNSPALVTGIFFSNRPVRVPPGGISVLDIAPTVLELVGVERPADYDGTALVFE